jgi:hypothetical protein
VFPDTPAGRSSGGTLTPFSIPNSRFTTAMSDAQPLVNQVNGGAGEGLQSRGLPRRCWFKGLGLCKARHVKSILQK